MRLVGVHGARVVRELLRHVQPGMAASRASTCRNDARAVELEAAVDRADALDRAARTTASSQPRPRAQLVDVLEELGDGRVVAVADALHERPRVAAAGTPTRTARPGNEVGRQWPSLSERIRRCRIDSARRRHAAAGSRAAGIEDGDVLDARRGAASRTRRTRRARRRRSRTSREAIAHLTEPASSPWTK